jgi:micrococcal nuclease
MSDFKIFLVFAIGALLIISLTGCDKIITNTQPDNTVNEDLMGNGVVTKITDGDTIRVNITETHKIEIIRILGIDTPETVDPRKEVQCYGPEASARAKELLLGKSVLLESDASQGDKDKYDRLLRYVFIMNGTNDEGLEQGFSYGFNMIMNGYAREYTYDKPYKYRFDYMGAEEYAKNNKLGLWGNC